MQLKMHNNLFYFIYYKKMTTLSGLIWSVMWTVSSLVTDAVTAFSANIAWLITAIAPIALFWAVLFLILNYGKTIVNYVSSLFKND
jgi:hypothetical protein